MLWRLSVTLLWSVTICAGALSAVTLWVLFETPHEPPKSELRSEFGARMGESRGAPARSK